MLDTYLERNLIRIQEVLKSKSSFEVKLRSVYRIACDIPGIPELLSFSEESNSNSIDIYSWEYHYRYVRTVLIIATNLGFELDNMPTKSKVLDMTKYIVENLSEKERTEIENDYPKILEKLRESVSGIPEKVILKLLNFIISGWISDTPERYYEVRYSFHKWYMRSTDSELRYARLILEEIEERLEMYKNMRLIDIVVWKERKEFVQNRCKELFDTPVQNSVVPSSSDNNLAPFIEEVNRRLQNDPLAIREAYILYYAYQQDNSINLKNAKGKWRMSKIKQYAKERGLSDNNVYRRFCEIKENDSMINEGMKRSVLEKELKGDTKEKEMIRRFFNSHNQ